MMHTKLKEGGLSLDKDFERCCHFLADMMVKYSSDLMDEIMFYSLIINAIDEERNPFKKRFDRYCVYLGMVTDNQKMAA